MNSIDSFYKDERNIIACVEIATKIDQFVDWAAIAPKENKDSVIALITAEKDTLIKAGTGVLQIRDVKVNNEYKAKHSYLVSLLKQLGLEPVHAYNDLWDWYNDYNLRELKTYQSRRLFIKNIFEPLLNTIQNSEESALQLISYEPTGWEKVDDGVARLKEVLTEANETADFQSVGMYVGALLQSAFCTRICYCFCPFLPIVARLLLLFIAARLFGAHSRRTAALKSRQTGPGTAVAAGRLLR